MKKLSFIALLIVAFASGCKKDEGGNVPVPNSLANGIELSVKSISVDRADFATNIILDSTYKKIICVRRASETMWDSLKITGNALYADGLKSNTAYEAKLVLSKGGNSGATNVVSFTTKNISITYNKFYSLNGSGAYYNTGSVVLSIEGGTHTIYGKGFLNGPVQIKLVASDDASVSFNASVNVASDSVLNFTVPKNMLSVSPYVEAKYFHVFVNDLPFKSYNAFVNEYFNGGNYADTANFMVLNTKIHIDSASVDTGLPANVCKTITLNGFFASSPNWLMQPDYLFGVPIVPSNRTLVVKKNGAIVRQYSVDLTGGQTCESATGLGTYPRPMVKDYYYYNAICIIKVKMPLDDDGQYSFYLTETMPDGTYLETNEQILKR